MSGALVPLKIRRWQNKLLASSSALTKSRKQLTEFPLPAYLSVHLLLSSLLLFAFVFLPRSGSLLADLDSKHSLRQTISADRPEHRFLTPITSDPVSTLLWQVIGSTICMIWWAGHLRTWWKSLARQVTEGTALVGTPELHLVETKESFSQRLQSLKTAVKATAVASPLMLLLLVALGAPMTIFYRETVLLSLHLAILTVLPVVDALKLPDLYDSGTFERYRLTRMFCELSLASPLERATVYPVFGAIIGAWMGVIPLALDWDRPWQAYPLTITFGSLLGLIIAGLFSFLVSAVEQAEREQCQEETAISEKAHDKSGTKFTKSRRKNR